MALFDLNSDFLKVSKARIIYFHAPHYHGYLADEVSFHIVQPPHTIFSEVDFSSTVMAERGPLAEVDTNVMGTPSFTGDKGVPSLGKVAHPDESLLPGKDSLTGEGSIEYSGLGHAALNSFLPETEQLKREDWDDFKEVEMEYEEQRFCSEGGDAEMENVDKDTSRESLKEKVEKPDIVRNLLGQQKKVTSTDSYPRSALKVLKALGLEPGCGDPLVGANLLPG